MTRRRPLSGRSRATSRGCMRRASVRCRSKMCCPAECRGHCWRRRTPSVQHAHAPLAAPSRGTPRRRQGRPSSRRTPCPTRRCGAPQRGPPTAPGRPPTGWSPRRGGRSRQRLPAHV
eukprot:361579-Chlamydomonas_euryale.AAC.2